MELGRNCDSHWKGVAKDVFSKWQSSEQVLRQFKRKKANAEEREEYQHAIRELSQLRQADLSEKAVLIKEKERQHKELESTLDLLQDEKHKLFEQQKEGNHMANAWQESITGLRKKIDNLEESIQGRDREIQVLKERNEDVEQVLTDKNDSKLSQLVTIVDNHDLLLSVYLVTFPQDEQDTKIHFLDKVTHRCSKAFKLLVNKCYEDLVYNLERIGQLISSVDSLIKEVFDLDVELEFLMYLRVVQCMNPSLFDTLEVTLMKQHDLTKHKIQYRNVELTQARIFFTTAYLAKLNMKNRLAQNQLSGPRKRRTPQKQIISGNCGPVGF